MVRYVSPPTLLLLTKQTTLIILKNNVSFFILCYLEEYLKEKHAIIAFVGNDKAEDAWPPTRQISLRYAQEVADHWDTGSFHINAKHKIDLLLPMLYLARKTLKLEELVPLPHPHQNTLHTTDPTITGSRQTPSHRPRSSAPSSSSLHDSSSPSYTRLLHS